MKIETAIKRAKTNLEMFETALAWTKYDLGRSVDCSGKQMTPQARENILAVQHQQQAKVDEFSSDIDKLQQVQAGKMQIEDLPFAFAKRQFYFGSAPDWATSGT